MCRAASAPDRTSATVEETQFHSAFSRHTMQITMRLVQFPRAGQHSSVFIGVGVAQHYLLPSSPGIEQRLIVRMPPQAPHRACPPRAENRSTQTAAPASGRDHESRRRTSQSDTASLRQANNVEHIVLGLRAADDVLTDRLCGINLLEPLDRTKSLDQLAGLRRNFAAAGRSRPLPPGPGRSLSIRSSLVLVFLSSVLPNPILLRSIVLVPISSELQRAPAHAAGYREPEDGNRKFEVAAATDRHRPPPAADRDSPSGSTAA